MTDDPVACDTTSDMDTNFHGMLYSAEAEVPPHMITKTIWIMDMALMRTVSADFGMPTNITSRIMPRSNLKPLKDILR